VSPADTERIKLTANFLNTLGSGTLLTSMVAPYIGWGIGSVHPDWRASSACPDLAL
jgi:hypothetical protein